MSKNTARPRLVLAALALLVALVAVLGGWQVVAARDSQRQEIENGADSASDDQPDDAAKSSSGAGATAIRSRPAALAA